MLGNVGSVTRAGGLAGLDSSEFDSAKLPKPIKPPKPSKPL